MLVAQLQYEVVRSRDVPDESEYRVEAIDERTGECYVAIFSGPRAKERAEEYVALKKVVDREAHRIAVGV